MLVTRVVFPSTDKLIVDMSRAILLPTFSAGLTVQRKLPGTHTRRMVTVRNDSGPQERQAFRRYGVNLWADDSEDAENMGLLLMGGLRGLPGTGPITAADSFSGPAEVDDDVPFTVNNKTLEHLYFAFRILVRGTKP